MRGLSGKGEDAAMEERESSHILSLITTSDPLANYKRSKLKTKHPKNSLEDIANLPFFLSILSLGLGRFHFPLATT